MYEISIEVNGTSYNASYEIFNDTLVVTFPDGSQRQTELRGLNPKSAARVHVLSYYELKYEKGVIQVK